MRFLKALCLSGVCAIAAAPAIAADKVEYAPPAAWIKPLTLPKPSARSDAAVELLLSDAQISLKPGAIETYAELAFYIRNPQGLSAGNIQFPWRPETDRLIVHKVQIRRGDQWIDLLAKGQTFTVLRRETNLESASLDGVLTATLQPEGLQVGDIINFAVTVVQADPVLKGHVEQAGALWNGFPIAKAHMRVAWPANASVRLRQSPSLPVIKPVDQDGMKVVDVSLDDVQPLNLPKGAPLRYRIGRIVEFSDFASWAEMAMLLAPLYEKASILPPGGKLAAEAARIKARTSDPTARAEAALALVQDRVRYVALLMGQGGLVPADAETSWDRRFADCKGKTAMLLGLLHALGIAADPVVVNVGFGDGLDKRLPMVGLFNHVIVRAVIGGKTYWLDGTHTGDTKLSQIEVPDLRWGLPLVKDAVLVPIMPPAYDQPHEWTEIQIDARQGLTVPAPIKAETVVTGDEAVASNVMFTNMTADVRDRNMRDFWRGQLDSIDIKTVGIRFDPVKREQHFTVEGLTTMDWSHGRYEADGMGIGYKADFVREDGPDRDAPFAVSFPYSERAVETILLPRGFSESNNIRNAALDETIAGIAYHRKATLIGDVFRIEKTQSAVAPEFPANDAPAAQKRLRELADVGLYLSRPVGYRETPQELAAKDKPAIAKPGLAADAPSVATRMSRAKMLVSASKCVEAIVEYDAVLSAEPKNVTALLGRAVCRPDQAGKRADVEKVLVIAPELPLAHAILGGIMITDGDGQGAVAQFDIALRSVPGQARWLLNRAEAYRLIGQPDRAMQDIGTIIASDTAMGQPMTVVAYTLRAQVGFSKRTTTMSAAERSTIEAAALDDLRKAKAAARSPGEFNEICWARAVAGVDLKTALAECDLALANNPGSSPSIKDSRAFVLLRLGRFEEAIEGFDAALAARPGAASSLYGRAIAYARKGDRARADADAAAAIAVNPKIVEIYRNYGVTM